MSRADHPLPRRVGDATAHLGAVMGLPLVDGVFASLVLAGALASASGVVVTGVLVFGGGGTLAVLLGSDRDRRSLARSTLLVGVPVVALAAVEGAFAAAVAAALDTAVFRRFAGLALLVVAAEVAGARAADHLPGPGVVVGLGLLASVDLSPGPIALAPEPWLAARAAAAALVGVGFALGIVALHPLLRYALDAERLRFGSGVALAVLGLSAAGLLPHSPLPLAVLVVAGLLAIDPGGPGGGRDSRRPTPRGGRPDPGAEPR